MGKIRYAIISDIHGNLEALKSVLEDISKQNVDRIICLGDVISKGCHSHECIELVKQSCDAVIVGNNELKYTKSIDEIALQRDFDFDDFYFNQKQLSADDIKYIKSLPMCCEFYLSGNLVRCFHASPDDADKTVISYENPINKLQQFKPTKFTTNNMADVVIYGHTHEQCMDKFFGRTLINCGSVGNSNILAYNEEYNSKNLGESVSAHYCIVSGIDGTENGNLGVEFRSVTYDIDKELLEYKNVKDKTIYARELKEGKYRYMERIYKMLSENGIKIDN